MSRPSNYEKNPIDELSVGLRIHNRRQSLSITQQQLAENIGCSPTHINRVESGRLPSLRLLFAICKQLDISMDEITGLTPDMDEDAVRVLDYLRHFNGAERDFVIKLISELDMFFQEMHKRSMYNRYSKRQRPYRSPEEDVLFWQVAEDTSDGWSNEKAAKEKIPAAEMDAEADSKQDRKVSCPVLKHENTKDMNAQDS